MAFSDLQVAKLQRGDVIFLAPRQRTNLDSFPALAAFVQSWPYADDKPWYHVAIATGGDEIVDFAPSSPGAGPGSAATAMLYAEQLSKRAIADDNDTIISALRMPNWDALAVAVENMVGSSTKYTKPGLLAFAAVSQARLFRDAPMRERLYNFAAGFEALTTDPSVAGDPTKAGELAGFTCVSAVVAALRDAGLAARLAVAEPAPPANALPDWAKVENSVISLYAHLQAGPSGMAPNVVTSNSFVTKTQIERAYLGGVMLPAVPGQLFLTTAQYLNELSAVILGLQATQGWTADTLIAAGANLRVGIWPSVASWAVSPAMLYDGLVGAGAELVM